jgi:predicted nucleic acid-binding protein
LEGLRKTSRQYPAVGRSNMVLVDTSAWVDHLKFGNEKLKSLLGAGVILCHPFIIGELACGSLRNRNEIISLLQALPQVPVSEQDEILYFIEANSLYGRGIGFVDTHLLASCRLAGCVLWTIDKRLRNVSADLELVFKE